MSTPAIQGPIAPYSNVDIEPQNYKPSRFVISAVGLGYTTTISTTVNHNYVIGQMIRLNIPPANGCRQLNGLSGIVLSIPTSAQVIVDINSSQNVDPFVSAISNEQPQILAIGDINSGHTNFNGLKNQKTYIPGSFRDIS